MAYENVNGMWPAGTNDGRDLKPTAQEAIAGFRRLYRKAFGRPYRGKLILASGNRRTWYGSQSRTIRVNPDEGGRGWHEIVHSVSHMAASHLHRENHGPRHAFIERELIAHVVKSGWLDGKLKRPTKIVVRDPRAEAKKKLDNVRAKIKAWTTKRRRAETAIKKLMRKERYYAAQAA